MDSSKSIAFLFLILVIYGFFLESQNKLLPVINALFGPQQGPYIQNEAMFLIALVGYVIITGFLDDEQALVISAILILGASIVNERKFGANHTFLNTLEGT